jgi:hypothetical protein
VAAGDTLQTIAKGAYGDANLWYLIADANGLSSNGDLRAGQVLTIPTAVGSANSANTFRPYDPSRITGNTSPTLMAQPGGQDKGCGAIGAIIVVIIAVVVTVITEGATSELLAESIMSSAGSMSAAEFATAAAVSNVAAGVAGAVAGSIASQAVGVAIGAQDSFSWKGVALAAVSGGVSGGLGGWAPLGSEATVGNAIVRSAVGSSLTQGIAVATGLQASFSWRSVAASAVGAGVGAAVAPSIGNAFGNAFGENAGSAFGARLATSLVAGATTAALRGGKFSIQQVATDAFGQALGGSVASANSSIGEQAYGMTAGEAEERSAAREVYGQQFQQASGVSIPGTVEGTGDHVVFNNTPANQWTSSLPNVNADFMGPRLSNDDASNLLDTLGLNRQTYNDGLGVQMARANVVNGRIQIAPEDGGVPSVSLPNNVGAKGFSPSDFSFHTYDAVTPSGLTDVKAIGQGIANYPYQVADIQQAHLARSTTLGKSQPRGTSTSCGRIQCRHLTRAATPTSP